MLVDASNYPLELFKSNVKGSLSYLSAEASHLRFAVAVPDVPDRYNEVLERLQTLSGERRLVWGRRAIAETQFLDLKS